MTKADLINELEKYPNNMEVKVYACCLECAKQRISDEIEVTTTKAGTAILLRIE